MAQNNTAKPSKKTTSATKSSVMFSACALALPALVGYVYTNPTGGRGRDITHITHSKTQSVMIQRRKEKRDKRREMAEVGCM
jgi:hypothetical protein